MCAYVFWNKNCVVLDLTICSQTKCNCIVFVFPFTFIFVILFISDHRLNKIVFQKEIRRSMWSFGIKSFELHKIRGFYFLTLFSNIQNGGRSASYSPTTAANVEIIVCPSSELQLNAAATYIQPSGVGNRIKVRVGLRARGGSLGRSIGWGTGCADWVVQRTSWRAGSQGVLTPMNRSAGTQGGREWQADLRPNWQVGELVGG